MKRSLLTVALFLGASHVISATSSSELTRLLALRNELVTKYHAPNSALMRASLYAKIIKVEDDIQCIDPRALTRRRSDGHKKARDLIPKRRAKPKEKPM